MIMIIIMEHECERGVLLGGSIGGRGGKERLLKGE
jgi:hypothetical protein